MRSRLRDRNAERQVRAQRRPAAERRIEFRVGASICDVSRRSDGDLMGDGGNIVRGSGAASRGSVCLFGRRLSEVRRQGQRVVGDLGEGSEKHRPPGRVFAFEAAVAFPPRCREIPSSLRMPDEEKIA